MDWIVGIQAAARDDIAAPKARSQGPKLEELKLNEHKTPGLTWPHRSTRYGRLGVRFNYNYITSS